MPRPFVSIGIIFKNEIRCLERCLSSLTPLREALPCELVMADTGADDGSREVAEKYADILIDFPWINDFAAARNAVMDRCSGRWYFSVDADEWLDGDIKELVRFVRTNNKKAGEACTVRIRNYLSSEADADYSDFMGVRMLRMSTGLRYSGAIHESWSNGDGHPLQATSLGNTILHHDGYIGLGAAAGAAKRKRNQDILLEELEADPENNRLLLQYIESSEPGAERMAYIRRAVAATEAKKANWQSFGPVIFRYAVAEARARGIEEVKEWSARAEELFPDSFYTQIDVSYYMFLYHWEKTDNYDECARLGERYLRAMEDYNAGRGDQGALLVSTLHFALPKWERALRILLAYAYLKNKQTERSVEMLDTVDFSLMDGEQTRNCAMLLKDLHSGTGIDTAPLILRLYEEICKPTPSEKRVEERKSVFTRQLSGLFSLGSLMEEEKSESFTRYACTLLAPLAGQHELGDAAAVMAAETVQEKEQALTAADKPYKMPREVLRRTILSGVRFPLREKPLKMEEMDTLADYVARRDGLEILKQAMSRMDAGFQQASWAKSVALAIVNAWEWADNEQSMDLARSFARAEEAFLSRCYTPDALSEENVLLLPPMHRFGWYCGKAFQKLESGDAAGYVQMLRTGLETYPKMKTMVEYLAEHTPQLRNPSQELRELAEKVRTLLATYDPWDPAVAALKQSEAYQKVAYLIEGLEVPVVGGLAQ